MPSSMRVQAIWKIIRGKNELLMIIALIALSFSVFSAMSLINSTYRMQGFTELMDENIIDCHVTLDSGLDPTEIYEHNLEDYQGWLEVEHQMKTHIIRITSPKTSLNYQGSFENISKQWDFSDKYQYMYFVGIDLPTFEWIQDGSTDPITNMNISYNQLEKGFIVANFLQEYERIFPELNLAISTDAQLSYDHSSPIYVDFFNENATNSVNSLKTMITKPNAICPLISSFEIFNEKLFYALAGITGGKLGGPVFLCGEELLDQFVSPDDYSLQYAKNNIVLNIRFDRAAILGKNPRLFGLEVERFRSVNQDPTGEFDGIFIENEIWASQIKDIITNGAQFQVYSALIFIPIFFQCGKNLSTSFSFFMDKRRNEFGLHLINGMKIQSLRKMLLGIGFVVGAIGGIIASISGIFLAIFMGKVIFLNPLSFSEHLRTQFGSLVLQNAIVNVIIGGLFAMFSLKKNLRTFDEKELQNNKNYRINLATQIFSPKKWQVIILLVFFTSLILAYIYEPHFDFSNYGEWVDEGSASFWILRYIGPLLGLFPFVIPILLISIVTRKYRVWQKSFQQEKRRETPKVSLKSPSYLKNLTRWNLTQNLSKNKKILEIFSLAMIFLIISVNIESSYDYSEEIHSSLYHANGEIVNIDFHDNTNLTDITHFVQEMQNFNQTLGYDHINTICHTQMNREQYDPLDVDWDIAIESLSASQLGYYVFSWANYSLLQEDTILRDEWFIGGTAEEILLKMQQPGSIMIPSDFLENGVRLNETLSFSYKTSNCSKIQKKGVVIGAYLDFPAERLKHSNGVNREIFMSRNLLLDARIELIEMVLYSNQTLTNVQRYFITQKVSAVLTTDFSLCNVDVTTQYHDKLDAIIFEIFQVEGYLLIVFALFGFFINSWIDRHHLVQEHAILRSKGLLEKELIKCSIMDGLVIGGLAFLLSLFSIIGVKGLLLYLNIQRLGADKKYFYLYIQMKWGLSFLILILGCIIFLAIKIGIDFLQIKSTRSDRGLEEYLRLPK